MLLLEDTTFKRDMVGPLINVVVDIDPSILVSAFIETTLAFICFSTSIFKARRWEYIFFGGLLGLGVNMLMWLQMTSIIPQWSI